MRRSKLTKKEVQQRWNQAAQHHAFWMEFVERVTKLTGCKVNPIEPFTHYACCGNTSPSWDLTHKKLLALIGPIPIMDMDNSVFYSIGMQSNPVPGVKVLLSTYEHALPKWT